MAPVRLGTTALPKWRGFDRIVILGKKHPTARCKSCRKMIQSAQPKRHLVSHAMRCELFPPHELRALELANSLDEDDAMNGKRCGQVTPESSPSSECKCPYNCGARPEKALNIQSVLLAMTAFVVCTGSAFRVVENEQFRALISLFCPNFKFPGRKQLASQLLNQLYKNEQDNIIAALKRVPFVTIVTNGWANPNRESIINFFIAAPGIKPIFWRSMCTGAESHTGEYIHGEVVKVIEELEQRIGFRKVIGLLSDNASSMLKLHELLADSHPWIFANGCAAHGTDLIVQAILKHPFGRAVLDKAVSLSKYIRNRTALNATFIEGIQSLETGRKLYLKLPVRTRWYSGERCIRGVVNNADAIQSLFRRKNLVARYRRTLKDRQKLRANQEIAFDESFYEAATKLLEYLSPISKVLAAFERDDCCCSMMYELYKELVSNSIFREAMELTHSIVPKFRLIRHAKSGLIKNVEQVDADPPERGRKKSRRDGEQPDLDGEFTEEIVGLHDAIRHAIEEKWNSLHTSAMGIAFLLDHTKDTNDFVGDDYYHTRRAAYEYARNADILNGTTKKEFIKQVKDFVTMKENWTDEQKEEFFADSPYEWWKRCKQHPELREVAMRVFSVCTSSAASERSWSLFRYLHSDARNKLKNTTVELMVFIYTNYGREENVESNDMFYICNPGSVDADEVADADEPSAPSEAPEKCSQTVMLSPSQRSIQLHVNELRQRHSFGDVESDAELEDLPNEHDVVEE